MLNLSKICPLALIVSFNCFASGLPTGMENIYGNANLSENGNFLGISSNTKNNVLTWKDFSVAKGNSVIFDDQNYLNIVKGPNASKIAGTVLAYGNIVLVNPNGINLQKGSTFQANNLTLSTSKISDSEIESFKRQGQIYLKNKGMGRVNLSGKIQTQNLQIQGSKVVIRNLSDIKNHTGDEVLNNKETQHIKIETSLNKIDLGGDQNTNLASDYKGISKSSIVDHRGEIAISDEQDFLNIENKLDGNYFLTDDLNLNLDKSIGNNQGFSGILDGCDQSISFNLNLKNYGEDLQNYGLFSEIYDAKIKNLLIKDSTINLDNKGSLCNLGALAGLIQGGTIENVAVENFSLNSIGELDKFNIGVIFGSIDKNGSSPSYFNNVIASFKDDNALKLKEIKNINLGSFAGYASDLDFIQGGVVLGLNKDLNTIGKNESSQIIASEFVPNKNNIEFLNFGDKVRLKRFYDPFYVENFSFNYDKSKNHVYKDLVNSKGFFIEEILDLGKNGTNSLSDAGIYNISLNNKSDRGRDFYFVSDNTESFYGQGKLEIKPEIIDAMELQPSHTVIDAMELQPSHTVIDAMELQPSHTVIDAMELQPSQSINTATNSALHLNQANFENKVGSKLNNIRSDLSACAFCHKKSESPFKVKSNLNLPEILDINLPNNSFMAKLYSDLENKLLLSDESEKQELNQKV